MNQANSDILTLDEVAVYLKAGKKTVYRLPSRGRYRIQAGRHLAVRRSELDHWIAEQIAEKRQDKT